MSDFQVWDLCFGKIWCHDYLPNDISTTNNSQGQSLNLSNLNFPKIKKLKKVSSDVWTCTTYNEKTMLFLPKLYSKTVFSLKMSYSFYFGSRGNLDFPDFPPKKFYNITYWFWNRFALRRNLEHVSRPCKLTLMNLNHTKSGHYKLSLLNCCSS